MSKYSKGSLIEFTDRYYRNYPPADDSLVRYGVCIEDTDSDTPKVETATGIVTARYVYASSWAGWIPDNLESVWEKHNVESCDGWEDF